MQWIIVLIIMIIYSLLEFFCAIPMLNLTQLNGYNFDSKGKQSDYNARMCCGGVVGLGAQYICYLFDFVLNKNFIQYFSFLPLYGVLLLTIFICKKQEIKPKIVLTNRMKRLLITFFTTLVLFNLLLFYIGFFTKISGRSLFFAFIPFSMVFFQFVIIFSIAINFPIEEAIKKHYKHICKQKLRNFQNLKVVGITGSYGKTSVKNILAHILEAQFKVYATPQNYNTPMGICKSTENIPQDTEVYIVEMGARHVGDIKEICDFVHSNIGIITGIASQHLETFGTIENIVHTKFELIDSIAKEDFAIINCFNKYCQDEISKRSCNNFKLGVDKNIFAQNIICNSKGSSFDLQIDNELFSTETLLLGKHNIDNILLAIAAAKRLGMSSVDIVATLPSIPQIEHRLETTKTVNGITIVDDGYNSNPEGAKLALETIKFFEGRKIIASQGLVELGLSEVDENFFLGQKIAECADIAILIGRNAYNLQRGMMSRNFDANKIYMVASLEKAEKLFSILLQSGDVLLLQNDLPDNY